MKKDLDLLLVWRPQEETSDHPEGAVSRFEGESRDWRCCRAWHLRRKMPIGLRRKMFSTGITQRI